MHAWTQTHTQVGTQHARATGVVGFPRKKRRYIQYTGNIVCLSRYCPDTVVTDRGVYAYALVKEEDQNFVFLSEGGIVKILFFPLMYSHLPILTSEERL